MSDINKILEEIQSLERAERQLNDVNTELDQSYKKLNTLQKIVDKEYADVEKLEKMSMKGLFHKVLGDKEKQLEQERQEYLQAFLKYKEYKKSLELLEFERKILEDKLAKAPDLKKRKAEILRIREQELIKGNSQLGRQLVQLDKDIQEKLYLKREVHEALIVGAKAVDVTAKMLNSLQTARNWGAWDMMGGNTTAAYMKHSHIDKARDMAVSAKHILSQLERELGDVYGEDRIQLNLNIDSFHSFTDIFFDNLITDWIVQKKIQHAFSNVSSMNAKVTRILNSLKTELASLEKSIQYLEQRKKDIVLNSGK